MATLHISDDIEARLASASKRTGRTPESLVEEILSVHLDEKTCTPTPEQVMRLTESIAQARRGELIPSEQVDAFFENWFAELRAR